MQLVAPSQGRGSKPDDGLPGRAGRAVAPSQGRGSKLVQRDHLRRLEASPHHRGADRNSPWGRLTPNILRRPITGARIETATRRSGPWRRGVAPSQGRGSKLVLAARAAGLPGSPHHRGADRNSETPPCTSTAHVAPSQGRGSKLIVDHKLTRAAGVAPSQGRGSKPFRNTFSAERFGVAPSQGRGSKHDRAGAPRAAQEVAPSQGRGSKLEPINGPDSPAPGRPITGARIETGAPSGRRRSRQSPHHRGADRNL